MTTPKKRPTKRAPKSAKAKKAAPKKRAPKKAPAKNGPLLPPDHPLRAKLEGVLGLVFMSAHQERDLGLLELYEGLRELIESDRTWGSQKWGETKLAVHKFYERVDGMVATFVKEEASERNKVGADSWSEDRAKIRGYIANPIRVAEAYITLLSFSDLRFGVPLSCSGHEIVAGLSGEDTEAAERFRVAVDKVYTEIEPMLKEAWTPQTGKAIMRAGLLALGLPKKRSEYLISLVPKTNPNLG